MLKTPEVIIEPGPQRSEFAVFVNDKLVFSRLQQRHYPEPDQLIELCNQST